MKSLHRRPIEGFPGPISIMTSEKLQSENGLVDTVAVDVHD